MERFFIFFSSMDAEKIVWVLAMIVGLCLFAAGIAYLISRKGRREIHYAWAACCEFLACWVLYIPKELFNPDAASPDRILHVVESLVTALLGSLNIYLGDGYQRMSYDGHALFSNIYGIVRVFANIALVVFVGGFILKFLNGPMQRFKLSIRQRRNLYVFSVCNEKTLSIAESIQQLPQEQEQSDNPGNRKKLIVFACGASTAAPEYRERIDALGGLYIDSPAEYVVKKYCTDAAGIEVFLFDQEEQNLLRLENICAALKKEKKNRRIRIMVELSDTPWDLYDDYIQRHELQKRDVIVNFVRVEECFVYSNLLRHSIFEHAAETKDRKEIRALIVGPMNARNIEMVKALLHLSQMPGYFLKLTILDPEAGKSRLQKLMPEVGEKGPGMGDGLYQLDHLENVDGIPSSDEDSKLAACAEFTFAFVNVGDDLKNINLALQLKAIAAGKSRKDSDYQLQVSMANRDIFNTWNQELRKGIEPVGSTKEIYSYQFITSSEIEQASEKIHIARHSSKAWDSYLNNEYNRHSVFARTLSFKYRVQLQKENVGSENEISWKTRDELEQTWADLPQEEKILKCYEHMRWNMYTRTLGYRADSDGLLTEYAMEDQNYIYQIHEQEQQHRQDEEEFLRISADRCQKEQQLEEIRKQLKQLKGGADDPKDRQKLAKEEETLSKELTQLKNKEAELHGQIEKLSDEIKELEKKKEANWKIVKAIRSSAKVHNDLVPFDKLPLTERIKDTMVLTEEVVEALRKI